MNQTNKGMGGGVGITWISSHAGVPLKALSRVETSLGCRVFGPRDPWALASGDLHCFSRMSGINCHLLWFRRETVAPSRSSWTNPPPSAIRLRICGDSYNGDLSLHTLEVALIAMVARGDDKVVHDSARKAVASCDDKKGQQI